MCDLCLVSHGSVGQMMKVAATRVGPVRGGVLVEGGIKLHAPDVWCMVGRDSKGRFDEAFDARRGDRGCGGGDSV